MALAYFYSSLIILVEHYTIHVCSIPQYLKYYRDDKGNVGSLVPALGFLMGTILHFHNPKKYNLLQTIISVEMYRSECNQKIFRWFQKLGWCKGVKGTRTAVDKLCTEFDDSINSWKNTEARWRHVGKIFYLVAAR